MKKEEARTIWNGMTNIQRKNAEEKFEKKRNELLQWKMEQDEKAIKKIKAEGRWIGGLDGEYPELEEISKEYKQRFEELFDVIREYK